MEGRPFAGARPSVYSGPVRVHRAVPLTQGDGPRSLHGTGSEHRVEHVFYFTRCSTDSPSHEGGTWTGDIASPAWESSLCHGRPLVGCNGALREEFGDINIRWGQARPRRLSEATQLGVGYIFVMRFGAIREAHSETSLVPHSWAYRRVFENCVGRKETLVWYIPQ